jgi:hypothetical protein
MTSEDNKFTPMGCFELVSSKGKFVRGESVNLGTLAIQQRSRQQTNVTAEVENEYAGKVRSAVDNRVFRSMGRQVVET